MTAPGAPERKSLKPVLPVVLGLVAVLLGVVGIVVGHGMGSSHARSESARMNATTVTKTETVTATSTVSAVPRSVATTPDPMPRSYSAENRVFSVGVTPSGGLTTAIPPGRYAVTIRDKSSSGGSWMRCSSILCGTQYMDNVLAIANASGADYSAVMEIEPTDVAVALWNLTLTPVE